MSVTIIEELEKPNKFKGDIKEFVFVLDLNYRIKETVDNHFAQHPFLNLVFFNDVGYAKAMYNVYKESVSALVIYCSEENKEEAFDLVKTYKESIRSGVVILVAGDESAIHDRRTIDFLVDDIIVYPFKIKFFMYKLVMTLSRRNKCSIHRGNLTESIKSDYQKQVQGIRTQLNKLIGSPTNERHG